MTTNPDQKQAETKTSSTQPARRCWCILRSYAWTNLSIAGHDLRAPKDGPQRFIPVFDTREQAVAWQGSDEHIFEMTQTA